MFVLTLMEHKFALPPEHLPTKKEADEEDDDINAELPPKPRKHPLEEGIRKELEKIFLDKVITDLGLCVSVYDIRSISGGDISPAVGSPTYKVQFRIIVFRPFVGEIIAADLIDSNEEGLRLSLGFFDDIYIPMLLFPESSTPETDSNQLKHHKYKVLWRWDFVDEDTEQTQKLYIGDNDEIKFRVHAVNYPPVPIEQSGKPFAPMVITGSIQEYGLGPVSWWPDDGDGLAADDDVDNVMET